MNFFTPLIAVLVAVTAASATAAELSVTTTADAGAGSLRDALLIAAGNSEADLITFNLPGAGPHVISLSTALPRLTETVSIINDRAGDEPVTIQRSTAPGTPLFRVLELAPLSNVVITGLTISNGATAAPGLGAGIFNSASYLTLRRCTVSGNVSASQGGGIASGGMATLDATDCTISNNVSQGGGGIYSAVSGRTALTNCTISNNSANSGGGLKNDGGGGASGPRDTTGELRIKSCTFSGNTARDFGGAIDDSVKNPDIISIVNSTITGNTAGYKGGGIIAYNGDTGAYLRLGNTIVAGNTSDTGTMGEFNGHDLAPGVYVTDGHNIVGRAPTNITGAGSTTGLYDGVKGDQVGTTKAPIDPKLGPLQMNGGSTQTHGLLTGSPAINKGDDTFAPAYDQRGYTRSGTSDVGAFELGGAPGPAPTPVPTRFANLSTRIRVEPGDNALIGGFIITGSGPKKIMLRAIGPSLALDDRLSNPMIDLYDAGGVLMASNDEWQQAVNRQEIINSRVAPTHTLESAILRNFDPGAYTAVVRDANGGSGIGLVELYDLGDVQDSKLANISTRGRVQTGENVMIAGVILTGYNPQKVLLRVLGPSVETAGKLLDPELALYDQHGVLLQSNDDWQSDEAAEIAATGIPPPHPSESAIVRTLSPAPYTAVVRGAGDTTGVAVVEVYALD